MTEHRSETGLAGEKGLLSDGGRRRRRDDVTEATGGARLIMGPERGGAFGSLPNQRWRADYLEDVFISKPADQSRAERAGSTR
jgi:hypothetical protein